MLHVPVTVRASSLHGLGVFAAAPIAKGTVVWSFTPGFDLETPVAQLEQLPELLQERLRHYGYIDKRVNRFVLCCDDARFLNHSSSPNLAHVPTDSTHGSDIAARDIEPGEELTIDYGNFEDGAAPRSEAGGRNDQR